MPAPAVIPALIAYVKVVAVKTLVVGHRPNDTRDRDPDFAASTRRAGPPAEVDVGQMGLRLYAPHSQGLWGGP